jgi:transcription elongation GreA/GreB family factor
MNKEAIRGAVIRRLEAELAVLVAAAEDSKNEATDQESRQEGRYDMRAQSAAYLAAGQAKLAGELAAAINAYRTLALPAVGPGDPAAAGTVVTLASGTGRSLYFIGPARGGMDIEAEGASVTVITSVSPLGRELIGRRVGDAIGARGSTGGPASVIAALE